MFSFPLRRVLQIACLSVVLSSSLAPDASAASKLADQLKPLISAHKGEVAVMVKHLKTGETFAYREKEAMSTASLIKFPLMVAAYQAIENGSLDLQQKVTLTADDKVPGSGILTSVFSDGAEFTLHDTIHLMIVYSDNSATNLVADQVGLPATADLMKELGCNETFLHSKVYKRDTSIFPKRSQRFGLGSTSAADMVKLLELLHKKELVSESASEKMIGHMLACDDNTKVQRYLPSGTKYAHKTGAVSACRTDAGIILSPSGPIAICVLTDKNEDRRWTNDNGAELLCAAIGKTVYDHFNAKLLAAKKEGSDVLRIGANGLLVEAVQRTLNERMSPSPNLSVDGDFGPMTQQALIKFQESKELKERGEVGPETWKALGTLVQEPNEASPEEINSQVIEKLPADDLSGPPFVTCKAWAIGEAKSGKLLWGSRAEDSLHMASTTKIMTGYLVAEYAAQYPEVLEETVVFSSRADNTVGSSSGVRAGEEIQVGELLYGLLLPSGNDASVALAEHFGSRLAPPGQDETDPYLLFVAAMNEKAKELGMENSQFINTHGLTATGHTMSAADLLTLSSKAMSIPLFKKCVGTIQRGCTVTGPGGYQRNLRWNNTNRLLKIEGFGGVKTGTTRPAGSCLVSQATRGEHSLIVVVLGATSTDARYVDSKNLFRWAWLQLGFNYSAANR